MSPSVAHSFNKLLSHPKSSTKSRANRDVEDSANRLRRMILVEGIPSPSVCLQMNVFSKFLMKKQDPTLRPRIWKILLRVNDIPSETYLHYVSRGPCQVREKIRNDTFRYEECLPFRSLPYSCSGLWPQIRALKSAFVKICWFASWMHLCGGVMVRLCLALKD